jgi:hypothetical protein
MAEASSKIRKYYFSVVVGLVKDGLFDIGYYEIKTTQDAHCFIKKLFIPKKKEEPEPSTKDFTNKDWIKLVAEVQQWAAEFLSIVIPDPNQQDFL